MHDILLPPPPHFCTNTRYAKYRAKVEAMALDPAIQTIIYCLVFLFIPLDNSLVSPLFKEGVYLLWVCKEVLQIISPGPSRVSKGTKEGRMIFEESF